LGGAARHGRRSSRSRSVGLDQSADESDGDRQIEERFHVLHNFTLKSVIYGSLAGKIKILNSLVGLGFVFAHDGLRAGLRA
jgi:hypothetical protein